MGNNFISETDKIILNQTSLQEDDKYLEYFLANDSKIKPIQIYDNHFGEIYLKEPENHISNNSFLKIMNFQDSATFTSTLQKFNKKITLSHENILKLYKFKTSKQNLLCSNIYKLVFLFEYAKRDLTSEIRSKRLQNISFSDEEIVNFIRNSVSGLSFFQKNHVSLGNLRAFTIFIDSLNNYKFYDGEFMNQPSNFSLFFINKLESNEHNYNSATTSGIYLSPELLAQKNRGFLNNGNNLNLYKCDVFTLGMIILEMINLKTMDFCYDYQNHLIKENFIIDFIEKNVKNKFHIGIFDFIEKCLRFENNKRPDFIELDRLVKELFEEKRLKIKGFKDKNQNDVNYKENFEDILLKSKEKRNSFKEENKEKNPLKGSNEKNNEYIMNNDILSYFYENLPKGKNIN